MIELQYQAFAGSMKTAAAGIARKRALIKDSWDDPKGWLKYLVAEYCGYGGADMVGASETLSRIIGKAQESLEPDLARIGELLEENLQSGTLAFRNSVLKKTKDIHVVMDDNDRVWKDRMAMEVKDEALTSAIFYQLLTQCLLPCVSIPFEHSMDGSENREPWLSEFTTMRPFVDGDHFWGWRGDDRGPKTIFAEGFRPKVKSSGPWTSDLWKAIGEEVAKIEQKGKLSTSVWYRYRQQDLCVETSVAIATRFESTPPFPFLDANKVKTYATLADCPASNPLQTLRVQRGGKNTARQVLPTFYVYAICKNVTEVHDTASIEAGAGNVTPWAEVSSNEVLPAEIKYAVEIHRWPSSAKGTDQKGWIRVAGVRTRKDRGLVSIRGPSVYMGPDEFKEDLWQYEKGTYAYAWTPKFGTLEFAAPPNQCPTCVCPKWVPGRVVATLCGTCGHPHM